MASRHINPIKRHLDAKLDPVTRERCGSNAGYEKHRYEFELPCDPCKEAHRVYANQGYRRRHPPRVRTHYNINFNLKRLSMSPEMFATVYFRLTPDVQDAFDKHYGAERIAEFIGECTGEEFLKRE